MAWRDWVEEMKDMGESLVVGLDGERKLTPFFVLDADDQTEVMAIAPRFFRDETRIGELLSGFLVPLVTMRGAQRCAWLLNFDVKYLKDGGQMETPECVILAVCDREVAEVWAAPIHRYEGANVLGIWMSWPSNATSSLLVSAFQAAMR